MHEMGKLEKSLLLNMQVPVAGIVAKIPNMASITDTTTFKFSISGCMMRQTYGEHM